MDNAAELHSLLLAKAAELNLPTHFKRDLTVHDLTNLTEAPNGTAFVWGIGECGTHCISLGKGESAEYWASSIKGMDHWFVLADGKLEPVTPRADKPR